MRAGDEDQRCPFMTVAEETHPNHPVISPKVGLARPQLPDGLPESKAPFTRAPHTSDVLPSSGI